ncbi:MAG TPA: ABC transporter permease [Aggregatilineales bacterium]|nr:ABC transporter permease [Aggregatilineales bacterium]
MADKTIPPLIPMMKEPAEPAFLRRTGTFFFLHRRVSMLLLLLPILFWLGIVYVGSLLALVIQSFYSLDRFTGLIVKEFTLETYKELGTTANLEIFGRTIAMAALVTVTCAIIAFPLAYYMGRFAGYRTRGLLYLAVMLPLWSSYIVRVYSWKLILAQEGIFNWTVTQFHLNWLLDEILKLPWIGGPSLSISFLGTYVVFVYIWLPFMILPINAAIERVPTSMINASADLGAPPGYTFSTIILPLAFPGIVAGSIFTFSLTLGDYIIPGVIGNSRFFIGQAVYSHQGTAGNIPLAAAMTVVPIFVMITYLLIARRLGAFNAL